MWSEQFGKFLFSICGKQRDILKAGQDYIRKFQIRDEKDDNIFNGHASDDTNTRQTSSELRFTRKDNYLFEVFNNFYVCCEISAWL